MTRIIVSLALVAALAVPAAAPAVVPPKNCGIVTVKGKRYQIKADQVTCRTAKTHAIRYLRTGVKPSGWRCTRYPSSSKFKFRCERGVRNIYAIKR